MGANGSKSEEGEKCLNCKEYLKGRIYELKCCKKLICEQCYIFKILFRPCKTPSCGEGLVTQLTLVVDVNESGMQIFSHGAEVRNDYFMEKSREVQDSVGVAGDDDETLEFATGNPQSRNSEPEGMDICDDLQEHPTEMAPYYQVLEIGEQEEKKKKGKTVFCVVCGASFHTYYNRREHFREVHPAYWAERQALNALIPGRRVGKVPPKEGYPQRSEELGR